jgi:hypothetical protein
VEPPRRQRSLYTALAPEGAEAEFRKFLLRAGLTPERVPPQDLVSLRAAVEPVLDLTDLVSQRQFLYAPEPRTSDAEDAWEIQSVDR